jgi:hypothetical protein
MGFWSDTFGGGNSFSESLANVTTPGDNYEYRGGDLYEKGSSSPYAGDNTATNYGTLGQADNRYTGAAYNEKTNANPNFQNVTSGGSTRSNNAELYEAPVVPQGSGRPTTMQRIIPGLALGAAGFGPIVAGAALYRGLGSSQYGVPQLNNSANTVRPQAQIETKRLPVYSDAYIEAMNSTGELDTPEGRIQGSFFKNEGDQDDKNAPMYKMNRFGNTYRVDRTGQNYGNSSLIREQAEAAMMPDDGGIAMVRRAAPITQATVPTDGLPAASAESEFAKQQILSPPAEWLIKNGYADTNPSYEAIRKYNTELRSGVASMAEGGDVEFALGGNEKDLINAAERAVRNGLQAQGMARGGELNLSDEDMIALAQYTQQYGVDALLGSGGLVDSVRTGEADETRARFAMGRNGVVRGNGDGSGTDDRVPAKLKEGNSEQDVLLADGEFVLRKDAYEALKDAGVNVDKVNDAGSNAAKELNKMMVA